MKNFSRNFCVVLLLFFCVQKKRAQGEVRDYPATLATGAVAALMTGQAVFKEEHRKAFKALEKREKEMIKKRNVASNLKSAPTSLLIKHQIGVVENRILACEQLVLDIKNVPNFLQHGLVSLEGDLATEKIYWRQLDNEYDIPYILNQTYTSGGTGYIKAVELKLLIRAMKIDQRVKRIKKDLMNLKTLNTNRAVFLKR